MVEVIRVSRLYETNPNGGPPQDKFLDGAAELDAILTPHALLTLLKDVERKVGRSASDVRWGPREIDLDILLYDNLVVDEADLKIPHPLLHTRIFAIEPLCEIAPDVIHPILGKSACEIFFELKSKQK